MRPTNVQPDPPSPVVMPRNPLTEQYDAIARMSGRESTVLPPPPSPVVGQNTYDVLLADDYPLDAGLRQNPEPVRSATTLRHVAAFVGIDLAAGEVIGDNHERFPMLPEETKSVLKFCFQVYTRSLDGAVSALAESLGLRPKVEVPPNADMPEVSTSNADRAPQEGQAAS